jgi:inactivated superfamily I helicase
MELQEGTKAWRKWNRTGELAEGRGLRAWRARRRWQRIYDNEPRPDPVAEAAVYGARQQAVAAAECECERRMAAVEGEWKRAQQEVGEVRASAAAIIAHAEGELERAYEAALKVVPVGVYV